MTKHHCQPSPRLRRSKKATADKARPQDLPRITSGDPCWSSLHRQYRPRFAGYYPPPLSANRRRDGPGMSSGITCGDPCWSSLHRQYRPRFAGYFVFISDPHHGKPGSDPHKNKTAAQGATVCIDGAERGGFEPPVPLLAGHTLSRRAS